MRCHFYVPKNNPEKADRNSRGKPRQDLLPLQRDEGVPGSAVLLAEGRNLPDFHEAEVEGEKGEITYRK